MIEGKNREKSRENKSNKADTSKEEKAGDWLWSPARRKKGVDFYEPSRNNNSNPSDYLALVCLQLQSLGCCDKIDFSGEFEGALALMLRRTATITPAQHQHHETIASQ